MSIAVSAIVRPSSGLRLLHAGLCGCVSASAWACPGWPLQLLCVLAGIAGWYFGRIHREAFRLDIYGVGQIRLTVYQQTGKENSGAPQRLLDGSTLWPGLLLLRLGDTDGRVTVLPVLPDSVIPADFRALALACRALAAHAGPHEK